MCPLCCDIEPKCVRAHVRKQCAPVGNSVEDGHCTARARIELKGFWISPGDPEQSCRTVFTFIITWQIYNINYNTVLIQRLAKNAFLWFFERSLFFRTYLHDFSLHISKYLVILSEKPCKHCNSFCALLFNFSFSSHPLFLARAWAKVGSDTQIFRKIMNKVIQSVEHKKRLWWSDKNKKEIFFWHRWSDTIGFKLSDTISRYKNELVWLKVSV